MKTTTRFAGFRVDQIDHVELFVPERREAAAWYRQVLGLEIVREHEHWARDTGGPLMISSDNGKTKLALFQGPPQGSKSTAGFHRVAFRVGARNFLKFLKRLDQHNLVDDRGRPVKADSVADHGTAFSLYFSDPFGHRLELTTYQYEETKKGLSEI